MKIGILVPHYGEHASRDRILEGSQLVEDQGFDSVWVRDHLIWKPHGMEGTDRTFVDAFVTLAAIAGATRNLELGTAVIIPIRWPLKVAQNVASLSYVSGRRVHVGFGLGSNKQELLAAGFDVEDREQIFVETVSICKQAWSSGHVDWHGDRFDVEDVEIAPTPTDDVVTWYGGTTQASVRRALRHCEGWLPGRLPFATLDRRLDYLRRQSDEEGKQIKVGTIPLVFLADSRREAASSIDIDALAHSSEGSQHWVKPASGDFRTIDDLDGLLMAGSPDDLVAAIGEFARRGVDELVLDCRLQFQRYEEIIGVLGATVLEKVRKAEGTGGGRPRGTGAST